MTSPKEIVINEEDEKQKTIFAVGQILPGFTKKQIRYYNFLVHLIKKRNGHGPFRICSIRPASRLVSGNKQQLLIEHLIDGQWETLKHNDYTDSSIIENFWIPGWIFIEPDNKDQPL
jgi:hypothetical protein